VTYGVDVVFVGVLFIGVLVARRNGLSDTLGRSSTDIGLGGFADLGGNPLAAIAALNDVPLDRIEVGALLSAFKTDLLPGCNLVGGDSRGLVLVSDITIDGREGTVR